MLLSFEKIILHNFGSYGHTEVDLKDKGFCLVSGQNNFKKDNAKSNGSGKSFLWSAICYALTGETIQGLTSNLKNVNIDEKSCYVSLQFSNADDHFVITRYIEPKSDLKIIENGNDISGKGIRESEKKLGEILPDLTKDLIASCIIIGQGMPNKFSSFSPSGRKDLLEQLTKSDFMIEDIKNRVSNRQAELNRQIRICEDSLLVNKTNLATVQSSLETVKKELATAVKPDFDAQIRASEELLASIKKDYEKSDGEAKSLLKTNSTLNEDLLTLTQKKTTETTDLFKNYSAEKSKITTKKAGLEAEIKSLKRDITTKKAITDICPTCGQKIPGAVKPDTSALEKELEGLEAQLPGIQKELNDLDNSYSVGVSKINAENDGKITQLRETISTNKRLADKATDDANDFSHHYSTEEQKLNKLKYDRDNWDRHQSDLLKAKAKFEGEENQIKNLMTITGDEKALLEAHQAVITKMETLIRRDFRGYLLTNVITYLDLKAKEYCKLVFGTEDLNIYLDGNALDISYCNKLIDNLSGGEKMRVDLILQLAIRDLLCNYFNFSSNIIVLDEITDFLDSKSCDAVMNFLSTTLKDIESVFIISHHADELNLPVDSEIKVIKNIDGISEVQ